MGIEWQVEFLFCARNNFKPSKAQSSILTSFAPREDVMASASSLGSLHLAAAFNVKDVGKPSIVASYRRVILLPKLLEPLVVHRLHKVVYWHFHTLIH